MTVLFSSEIIIFFPFKFVQSFSSACNFAFYITNTDKSIFYKLFFNLDKVLHRKKGFCMIIYANLFIYIHLYRFISMFLMKAAC